MPGVQMPGAAAPEAAVPDAPMPVGLMPAGAMSVGVKTPTKGEQEMMDIHAGLQRPAHLGKTGMQDQSTDISVGMATMTTAPTPIMPGTTGITRWRMPVLWKKGWVRANLRRTTRATISTGSMTKTSWTVKVHQVQHVSDLGS